MTPGWWAIDDGQDLGCPQSQVPGSAVPVGQLTQSIAVGVMARKAPHTCGPDQDEVLCPVYRRRTIELWIVNSLTAAVQERRHSSILSHQGPSKVIPWTTRHMHTSLRRDQGRHLTRVAGCMCI